jgi:multisubunit Na+/H+ antiporter MnhE subunit
MKTLRKIAAFADFIIFYLVKLVTANIYIAYDILTPKMHTRPGFVRIPLTIVSRPGLLLFSNLLSMTPGTLTIEISPDKKTMLVHVLYGKNQEKLVREIDKIQEKIKRITP